jgi:preprotein translocase subunit SecB
MSKKKTEDALRSAAAALRLRDIVLHAARFSQPTRFDGEVEAHELVKRAVQYQRVASQKDTPETLAVHVGLGVRVTAGPNEKADIFVEIEADFVASYEFKAAMTAEAVAAFATFNAVHNVWPFWRQHVFDIVNRAHLFPIEVPLFSGGPTGGVAMSDSKSKAGSAAGTKRTGQRRRQVKVRKKV